MNVYGYIFAIILLTIIDFTWLSINKKMYNSLVNSVQGTNITMRLSGALIAYPLMYIGLVFIVFKLIEYDKTEKNKLILSLKYGALFGFIVYGIYNATNYAIFSGYKFSSGIIDTMWGTFAYFITTYITLLLF
jgi:uncharacterized membrane protein